MLLTRIYCFHSFADGTVLQLHEFLFEELQARHEEQAGAKLHCSTTPLIRRLNDSTSRTEKTHDSTLFNTGSWLDGRLMLLDLAYFKYRQFALIDENDGHFVSRLKESANPVVTEELRGCRGRAIPRKTPRFTMLWRTFTARTST